MAKLYILMPVLNCLDMTKGAYDSIHIDCHSKLIIIDQASDDGTKEWAEGMVGTHIKDGTFLQVEYIRNDPRIALASAWNQGVKLALEDKECEYIAILNNDIVLHSKTLINLMRFMDKTGYLLVTGDNIKDKMSIEVMQQMELPKAFTDYDCDPINDWRAEGPDFSCYMINKETVRVIGTFDENFKGAYCEDWDFHRRIRGAFLHIKEHNDKGIEANRVHAKRLSTAPYYHYASQTLVRNTQLRNPISIQHGKNIDYYVKKWGAIHDQAMDGVGNTQPFGDASKDWTSWELTQ